MNSRNACFKSQEGKRLRDRYDSGPLIDPDKCLVVVDHIYVAARHLLQAKYEPSWWTLDVCLYHDRSQELVFSGYMRAIT